MVAPTCHVFCERRGSRLCVNGELTAVKTAVSQAAAATEHLIAGDYTEALGALEAALAAARAGQAANNGRAER